MFGICRALNSFPDRSLGVPRAAFQFPILLRFDRGVKYSLFGSSFRVPEIAFFPEVLPRHATNRPPSKRLAAEPFTNTAVSAMDLRKTCLASFRGRHPRTIGLPLLMQVFSGFETL